MKINLKLNRTTYRMIICTLLIIAGGLYYFNRDEVAPPQPPAQEAKSDAGADITFSGSTITEQQDGKRQWELTAETIKVDPNTNKARLINLKGVLYREDGSKLDIVARQGEMDTKTKDIEMEGDVKATASDGAVFTAAKVRWVGKDRMLFGSGGITLTRDDVVVTGDTIEGEELLQRVKVKGNARVIKGGNPQ